MVFKARSVTNRASAGMTLSSFVIGMGVGVLVLSAVASIYLYSAKSFVEMDDFMTMDGKSRLAMDRVCREIRQANALVSFDTNHVSFLVGNDKVSFTHNAAQKTLLRTSNGVTEVILPDCVAVDFDLFQRVSSTNGIYSLVPATSTNNCLVVQAAWTCSREVLNGRVNTSTLKSAQIVLRNRNL